MPNTNQSHLNSCLGQSSNKIKKSEGFIFFDDQSSSLRTLDELHYLMRNFSIFDLQNAIYGTIIACSLEQEEA